MTTAEELFPLFPQLAARITNLRSILQHPAGPISSADKLAWVEDVKSTMDDFMVLMDKTAAIVRSIPTTPSEPLP